jgi:Sigma-70, region 4
MKEENQEPNIQVGEKPWLSSDGKLLTDDQLRIVSQKWTPAVWEAFLVETVERPLKEINEKPWAYQAAVDRMTCTFWNEGGFGHADEQVAALVRQKIRDHLTAQQRQILRHHFWDGMSEREVAEKMSITYGQVHTSKKNSLSKLKELLPSDVCSQRIVARSVEFPPLEHPKMDLDVYAAYLEDLAGPKWCRGG